MRQVAEILGKTKLTVYNAIASKRLIGAHWVDRWWVIQEDFRIIRAGVVDDVLLRGLPPEIIADEPPKNFSADMPEYRRYRDLDTTNERRSVHMPGFAKVTEGLSGNQVRNLTGVHNQTQTRILKGDKVDVKVALRLANALDIDVEELLRA